MGPGVGNGPGPRVGGERGHQGKPAKGNRGNGTGLAAGRDDAQPRRCESPRRASPFPCWGKAPSGARDFSPTPSPAQRPLSVRRGRGAASTKKKVKVAAPEVGRKSLAGSGSPRRSGDPAAAPAPDLGGPGSSVLQSEAFPPLPRPDPDS